MRMDFDLYEYLNAAVDGTLSALPQPSWRRQSAVCVVLTSEGYPDSYPKGDEISGLDYPSGPIIGKPASCKTGEPAARIRCNHYTFHAGTERRGSKILSNGGRVLGVTALGDSLQSAIFNAYTVAEGISWPHKFCRRDIGQTGLSYL